MVEPVVMIVKYKLRALSTLIMHVVWILKNPFLDMFSLCLTQ